MKGERNRIYADWRDFFELEGSVAMKLTPRAAVDVCKHAAAHKLVVARIEGGIWHNPGFEARLDCIWNGMDPPVNVEIAAANNYAAANYIEQNGRVHSAFILTAPPITGWPHKEGKTRQALLKGDGGN